MAAVSYDGPEASYGGGVIWRLEAPYGGGVIWRTEASYGGGVI